MGKQHIIELNGKRYDAVSGNVITDNNQASGPSHKSPRRKAGRSIDGFMSPSGPQPKTAVRSIVHHSVEKSKTLMRKSVAKPTAATMNVTKKIIEIGQQSVSPQRSQRAKNTKQSQLVKHFGEMSGVQTIKPKLAAVSSKAVASMPAALVSLPRNFSMALSKAETHKQPKIAKKRWHHKLAKRLKVSSKVINTTALILAVITIGGYFTYMNLPNLNMRLAAARANVHASLPSYKPSGFHLASNISIKPGQVTINYDSNSDKRNFAITQTASGWNSESLKDNYLADKTNLQSIQDQGKTVYIYNDNSATWVDGGVWYRIEGNSQLGSDQLQKIAHSL